MFESYSAGTERKASLAGQERALDIAAHGDDHIRGRNFEQEFAVLPVRFHVDALKAFHQPDGVGVDGREDWGLEDPTGQPDEVLLETIRQIEQKVLVLKAELK